MNKIIVSKEDFLNTYKNKAYGYKALKLCKKNRWLPMKNYKELASIFGRLIGDGNLSKDSMVGDFRFYGYPKKLNKIKRILRNKFKLKPYLYYPHPKKGGYILRYNNAVFSRILNLAGVPRGNKIFTSFKVPDWIMNGNQKVKRAFLSALFADEMTRINKRANGCLGGGDISMSKVKEKSQNLIYFLNQLKELLNDLNVESSSVRLNKNKVFYRKDGGITYPATLYLSLEKSNREKFYNNVGFDDKEKQNLLYQSIK